VVGSDIDADGLLGGGLAPSAFTTTTTTTTTTDISTATDHATTDASTVAGDATAGANVLPPKKRSKNVNFQRKNGQNQLGLCTMDNFKYYNMQDQVLDLIGVGVDQWLLSGDGSGDANRDAKILKYDKVSVELFLFVFCLSFGLLV